MQTNKKQQHKRLPYLPSNTKTNSKKKSISRDIRKKGFSSTKAIKFHQNFVEQAFKRHLEANSPIRFSKLTLIAAICASTLSISTFQITNTFPVTGGH